MNRKGKKRTLVPVLSMVLIVMLLCSGCKGKTQIILTTPLGDNELFRIGDEVCTVEEAKVFLTTTQNQYETLIQPDMWDKDFGGMSLEEYVKESILSQLTQIKSMALMAEERKVTLDESETKAISAAAKEYYQSLTAEELSYLGITVEQVENLYTQYALAEKLYEEVTADVDTEVSDDEARSITVQQIYIPKTNTDAKTKATEAHEKVMAEDADFEAIALTYNEDGETEAVYRKGSAEEALENVVFSLDINQISEVVEGESGYYIIKCISSFNREETDANKAEIINQRKTEAFDAVYQEFIQQQPSQFNDELWKKLELKSDGTVSTSNFFGIYNQFMDIE